MVDLVARGPALSGLFWVELSGHEGVVFGLDGCNEFSASILVETGGGDVPELREGCVFLESLWSNGVLVRVVGEIAAH